MSIRFTDRRGEIVEIRLRGSATAPRHLPNRSPTTDACIRWGKIEWARPTGAPHLLFAARGKRLEGVCWTVVRACCSQYAVDFGKVDRWADRLRTLLAGNGGEMTGERWPGPETGVRTGRRNQVGGVPGRWLTRCSQHVSVLNRGSVEDRIGFDRASARKEADRTGSPERNPLHGLSGSAARTYGA